MQTHEHSEPLFATIPDDITAHRHRGNAESTLANPSVFAKRQAHERIIAVYRTGDWTGQEVSDKLSVPYHTISGRISEMRHILKLLEKTGERRNKGAVLTLKAAEVTV